MIYTILSIIRVLVQSFGLLAAVGCVLLMTSGGWNPSKPTLMIAYIVCLIISIIYEKILYNVSEYEEEKEMEEMSEEVMNHISAAKIGTKCIICDSFIEIPSLQYSPHYLICDECKTRMKKLLYPTDHEK